MDVVRRNTDYAVRLMVNLARRYGDGPVSTRTASTEEQVSYQLACKLMQSLQKARLLKSMMGPKGGFSLGREPSEISLLDIISAIQGPISLNRCVLVPKVCPQHKTCTVRDKLADLQKGINDSLSGITLEDLLHKPAAKRKANKK
ncbi:MAG: Rrf2 family transcriptional regulator [Sedimentisphaerales bacterium]|nr:Rrf2 family transcriptional regulator [Sedimentisphaerales bacterium]